MSKRNKTKLADRKFISREKDSNLAVNWEVEGCCPTFQIVDGSDAIYLDEVDAFALLKELKKFKRAYKRND